MTNDEFVDLMDTGSSEPPSKSPWAEVRWINIRGLSWDVMKALSIAYSAFCSNRILGHHFTCIG